LKTRILTPKNDKMPAFDGLAQPQLDSLLDYVVSLK